MSEIDHLSLGTSLDLSGLTDGVKSASDLVDEFFQRNAARLQNIPTGAEAFHRSSSSGSPAGDGGAADQAAQLVGALMPIASKLQSTILAAVKPLTGIGATISAQFQQVGSTLESIGKRASAHMKFVETTKALDDIDRLVKSQVSGWDKLLGRSGGYPYQLRQAHVAGAKLPQDLYNALEPTRAFKKELGDVDSGLRKLKAPRLNFTSSTQSILTMQGATAKLQGAAVKAATSFKGLGAEIAIALGAFGLVYKAVGFLKSGITSASSLNETLSKTDAVLGSASAGVKAFADDMATRFGKVKGETLDVAAGLGGLAKGLGGLDGKKLEGFTKQFTGLAYDLQSFGNIPDFASAGDALRIALSGEQSDQLKRLGVVMNQDAVEAKAFAAGIAQVGTKLNEQQKFAARALLISEAFAKLKVTGDLEKTAGGTANQFRKLTGTITNLGTAIGSALLPVVDTVISLFSSAASRIGTFFEANKPIIDKFVSGLSYGFEVVVAGIAHLLPALQAIGSTIAGAAGDASSAFGTLLPSFGSVADGIKSALLTINTGLQTAIDWIKGIPAAIDSAFGQGTTAAIVQFAADFGGITAAAVGISAAIGVASATIGGLVAVFTSVPVLIGAAGAAIVTLTSDCVDWAGIVDTVAFSVRNMSDIWAIAQLQIGQKIAYVLDNLALIPTNLGRIASYVGGNWLELMTAPVKTIASVFAELGKSILNFLKNPTGGFSFNFDAAFADLKKLQAKLPEMAKAPLLDIDNGLQERYDSIAKKEEEHRKKLGQPFEMPKAREVAPASAPRVNVPNGPDAMPEAASEKAKTERKPIELKFAGAEEVGTKEAYTSIVRSISGRTSGMEEVAKSSKKTSENTSAMVGALGRIEQRLNGPQPTPMVI